MSLHDHSGHRDEPQRSFLASHVGLALGFIIIAGALLLTEHRAHLWGVLIWLPLLACPLMHFFMHGGHGHGGQGSGNQGDRPRSAS
jgi:Protein of unknown function (DUF2933)